MSSTDCPTDASKSCSKYIFSLNFLVIGNLQVGFNRLYKTSEMAFAIFRDIVANPSSMAAGYIPLEISPIGNLYRLALSNLKASEMALAIFLDQASVAIYPSLEFPV